MNKTPVKKTISLSTKRGAQSFLRDLKKEIPKKLENWQKSELQGFKSKYYHLRRIKEFEKGLASKDKAVVKKTIRDIQKYATRGGKHKKTVEVKQVKNRVVYIKEWRPRGHKTAHGTRIVQTFYQFILNWNYIKDILLSIGAKNTPLTVFMFGIGRTYEQWREKASRLIGSTPDQLITWFNWAADIYRFRRQDFNNTIELLNSYRELMQSHYEQEDEEAAYYYQSLIEEIWKDILQWYKMYEFEPEPKSKFGQGTEANFLDLIEIAAQVGNDLVNQFGW